VLSPPVIPHPHGPHRLRMLRTEAHVQAPRMVMSRSIARLGRERKGQRGQGVRQCRLFVSRRRLIQPRRLVYDARVVGVYPVVLVRLLPVHIGCGVVNPEVVVNSSVRARLVQRIRGAGNTLILSVACVSAFMAGCGVTEDGTSGAEQCSQAAAVQACPVGSVPRLDAASAAQCGGTASGSYSPISGGDGSISGACAATGECAFACVFETPCRCGIETLSRDAIVCTGPCAACGDGECTDGESVTTCPQDCTVACGNGACEAGESVASCPQDCTVACGNGECEAGENSENCPRDCGAACGDGVCEAGENSENCALDCGGACVAGEQRCNGTDRQVCNPRGQFETIECPGENRCRETEGGATECVTDAAADCDAVSRCCDGAFARNVGEACDDGLFCTSSSSCTGEGVCAAPVERDCAGELSLNECQAAACDEVRDRCEAQASNEGAVCDNPETATGDRCVDGACVASECECGGINDCCDGCFVRNVGGTCDDGAFCTAGDTCSVSGQCVPGASRSCAGTSVGNCQTAVCDDEVDACRAVSSPDLAGTSCDDGLYCTVGEACTAGGACEGGRARDCSGIINVAECQANAACDDTADQCTFVAINAGAACTSPDFCTVNGTCTAAGACTGTPRDCSAARTEPACQGAGVCNSAAGRCEAPPSNEGGACDDGLLCTSGDRCTSGACGGSEIECGTATACRGAGICDEAVGTCSGTARPDGTSCTITNGFGLCTAGACGITSCRAGFADCDGSAANGCETATDTNAANCGGCGFDCSASHFSGVCQTGYCALAAGTRWTYCESPSRGSRPVNLESDVNNCGACAVRCGALSECVEAACTAVPLEFVRIEAGTFQMGSPTGELGRQSDEIRHSVTLTRDFFMGRTEVTQNQWQELMNTDAALVEQPNLPMPASWWDAAAFANALSLSQGLPQCYLLEGCTGTPGDGFGCTGVSVNTVDSNPLTCTGYRLPTEAEWEYSYRAGTTTAFYNGPITSADGFDPNLDLIAWCSFNASQRQNVGGKLPNAWGLYDMAGNVWERVWDWYGEYTGTVTDPISSPGSGQRVIRGGSFSLCEYFDCGRYNRVSNGRAAFRAFQPSAGAAGAIGFRLARTAP
jgi:formylglycine-generating enzyme required for sulfatase activity